MSLKERQQKRLLDCVGMARYSDGCCDSDRYAVMTDVKNKLEVKETASL
jgi:hypothetical protein